MIEWFIKDYNFILFFNILGINYFNSKNEILFCVYVLFCENNLFFDNNILFCVYEIILLYIYY